MTIIDVVVLAAVGGVAAWPLIGNGLPKIFRGRSSIDYSWRQKWAHTIIELINQIEEGQKELRNPDQALLLSKELVWELIGGDGGR